MSSQENGRDIVTRLMEWPYMSFKVHERLVLCTVTMSQPLQGGWGQSMTPSPSFLGLFESIGAHLPLLLLTAIGPADIGPDPGSQVDKNGCDNMTYLVEWPCHISPVG